MKRRLLRPQYDVLAAIGAFLIAAILFAGLLLKDYLVARIVIGFIWTIAGIGWSSRYYQARLEAREQEIHDLRAGLLAQAREAAAQQERNRLARNLHDSIKQQVFGIGISAAAAEARWESDPAGAREALDDVRRSAQEAMVEMNALLQQLSPAPLEKVGLAQALREQGEALGYRADAAVEVEFGPLPGEDRLPAGAQESLFRIAQEAFSNVARHARAGRVRVYLGQHEAGGPLALEIHDDGQGFDPDKPGGGMGLENIRQRALALGGELALQSAPGRGTTVHVTIPLAETLPAREEPSLQPRHALNKVFLAGLGGGVALALVLLYPLYVLVPGRYAAEWTTGSAALGLLLEILGALLAVACGFLAARWSRAGTRRGGALAGALGGAIAGAVLYGVLGAAAADVIGGGQLLAHGLVPAGGRVEVLHLLVGALVRMVWWSHGAFWTALLAGTGLGVMGGILAPPGSHPPERSDLPLQARTLLTVFATAAAFSLLAAVRGFALFAPTLRAGLARNDVAQEAAPLLEGLSCWLVGTPLALYLLALAALYFLLRSDVRTVKDPVRLGAIQAWATWLAFLSLGIPVYLGTLSSLLLQGTTVLPLGLMDVLGLDHPHPVALVTRVDLALLIVGLAGSLALGGLYLSGLRAAHRRRQELGFSPPPLLRTIAAFSGLLGLGVVAWGVNVGAVPHAYVFAAVAVLIAFYVVLIAGLLHAPRQAPAAALTLAQLRWAATRLIRAGPGSTIAAAIPPMTVISTVIGMGLVPVKLIEALSGRGGPGGTAEITLRSLVGRLYLDQAGAGLLTLVAAAAAVGLLTLLLNGIVALVEQWSGPETPPEGK